MRALLLRSIGSTLLLLGCTDDTPTGGDAATPTDDNTTVIDSGVKDTGGGDTGVDVPAAMDRVDVGVAVDRPATPDVGTSTDVGSATPDVGTDAGRCAAGETRCGAACVRLATDPMNCGACGRACPAGRLCNAGACTGEQRSCPPEGGRGCGLVEVTGGTFAQGDVTLPSYVHASPVQPMITVSDFAIDAYEVTVGRFRRFWAAGHPNLPGDVVYPGGIVPWFRGPNDVATEPDARRALGCDWSTSAAGQEFLPLVCIDVATAQCFCVWDGGRLPTESEWEYVAKAWPIEGLPSPRLYPWGNQRENTQCVVAQFGIVCPGDTTIGTPYRQVGSYPPIGGIFDLAGNVYELTASGYVEYAAPSAWGGIPRVDPFASDQRNSGGRFVIRGGRFEEQDYSRMNGSARDWLAGDEQAGTVGFRCVRSRRRP